MNQPVEVIAVKEVNRFFTDRELEKVPFTKENYQANVVEELLELEGLDVSKENRPKLRDAFLTFIKEMEEKEIAHRVKPVEEVTEEDTIDVVGDIEVFSMDAALKMGYDNSKVLLEVSKVINSRVGKLVDGKFQKDLSVEAQANWHEADFSTCKL